MSHHCVVLQQRTKWKQDALFISNVTKYFKLPHKPKVLVPADAATNHSACSQLNSQDQRLQSQLRSDSKQAVCVCACGRVCVCVCVRVGVCVCVDGDQNETS